MLQYLLLLDTEKEREFLRQFIRSTARICFLSHIVSCTTTMMQKT